MELNIALKHRLDTAFFQIIGFGPAQRMDLQHMWRYAKNLWNLMDQEMIQCRRQHKPTIKYLDLEQQLTEAVDNIEKYITFGMLTK